MHVVFSALSTYAIPVEAQNEKNSLEISGSHLVWEN